MNVAGTALTAMAAATQQLNDVADRVARSASPDPAQFDTVDISAEAVKLLSARSAFEVAVRVARIANETEKAVLDLLA
jgi:hypothetical protein